MYFFVKHNVSCNRDPPTQQGTRSTMSDVKETDWITKGEHLYTERARHVTGSISYK